jgi:hypothetical protein
MSTVPQIWKTIISATATAAKNLGEQLATVGPQPTPSSTVPDDVPKDEIRAITTTRDKTGGYSYDLAAVRRSWR